MEDKIQEQIISRSISIIVNAERTISEKDLIVVRLYKKEPDVVKGKIVAETDKFKIYVRS